MVYLSRAGRRLLTWLSPDDANRTSHRERWFSALGGFVALFVLLWINTALLSLQGAAMVVASMGASLVLLFAVPHGALSQPWALFGGHLVSALIGVSCARWIGDPLLGGALAVGLAIGAMHYLHCIHPPGGATALVAVLGGEELQQLGYGFVLQPVLENVVLVLILAVLINLPLRWRRYPASIAGVPAAATKGDALELSHADLSHALAQLESYIDVSESDLIRIYALAQAHAEGQALGERAKNGAKKTLFVPPSPVLRSIGWHPNPPINRWKSD